MCLLGRGDSAGGKYVVSTRCIQDRGSDDAGEGRKSRTNVVFKIPYCHLPYLFAAVVIFVPFSLFGIDCFLLQE